jgi:hypothetical protein
MCWAFLLSIFTEEFVQTFTDTRYGAAHISKTKHTECWPLVRDCKYKTQTAAIFVIFRSAPKRVFQFCSIAFRDSAFRTSSDVCINLVQQWIPLLNQATTIQKGFFKILQFLCDAYFGSPFTLAIAITSE